MKEENIDDLCTEFNKYFDEIKSKDHQRFDEFQSWLRLQPQFLGGEGLLSGQITALKNDLEELKNKSGLRDRGQNENLIKEKARRFINAAKVYLAKGNINDLTGEEWFVYFFYQINDDEPQLGRNVLKIVSSTEAILDNIQDGTSENYTGLYWPVNNMVVFFTLYPENKDRLLNIKFYRRGNQELCLGHYSTFENAELVSGSIVAYRIPQSTPAENKVAQIWSYHDIKNCKNLNDTERTIVEYLSVRSGNHFVAPTKVTTVGALRKHLHNLSHHENTHNRFIETGKPIVFIATPNTTVKDKIRVETTLNFIEQLKSELMTKFPELSIEDDNEVASTSLEKMRATATLRLLQRTRIFILVISETNKSSFSLVQLGWAIAFCKHVILVYKEGTISERIKSLGHLGVERISFSDLKDEVENVKVRVINLVNDYI